MLNNKLYFSQDGKFIFIVFVNNGILWKGVTFNSEDLSEVKELEFDLSKTQVRAEEVRMDVHMASMALFTSEGDGAKEYIM